VSLARLLLSPRASAHLVPDGAWRALCGAARRDGGWVEEPAGGRRTCGHCEAAAARLGLAVTGDPGASPIPLAEIELVDQLAAEWPHVARVLAEEASS
jgi:hypothetical protein